MAGRRPIPTALNLLHNNPGNRALNHEEPQPRKGLPEMPKELRETARREWRLITADLEELGVLTVVDGKALAMYCDAYADWEETQRMCVEQGIVIDEGVYSKLGDLVGSKLKVNPAFTAKYIAMKTMKSFLIEYGLTPASRSRLKMGKQEAADPEGVLTRAETPVLSDDEVDLNSIDETRIM
jgi:P27 family predicted phage terminase small subunit